MQLDRRTLLKGIGAAGATLAVAGKANAAGGDAQYVVLANNGNAAGRLERDGFEVKQVLADGEVLVVSGPEDAAEELRRVGGVSDAEPDVRLKLERPVESVPEDDDAPEPPSDYPLQWDKQVTESLAANETATGADRTVAVIDTGIDYAHPELTPNLDEEAGRLFRQGEVRSGEGSVVVPDNYEEPSELETADFHVADEQEGHGTHVAGTVAASGEEAVIGTAPDATLVALRVFWWTLVENDDGELEPEIATTTGDVLAAIDHAADRGYDAANLSLGTPPLPPETNSEPFVRAYRKVTKAATQRGTNVVASAGNAETDLQRGGLFSLPNSTQGAFSVAATGPNDEGAFYTNFGTNEIDVGAPGGGYETAAKTLDPEADVEWPFPLNLVYSTTSPRVEGAPYGWKAGTSMAAPQVSGLVALVRELAPESNTNQVESAIKHGAEGANGRSDPVLGAGRINAANTVDRLDD